MSIIDQASYSARDVEIETRKPLYQGFIQVESISLRHRLFAQDGYTGLLKRELVHRPEAAGVLIYNDTQQKFALIEQFRIGAVDDAVSPWQLEIIAGLLDAGESAEQCLRRESLEEAGCVLLELEHIFSFYPSAGACSERFHLYAAQAELPAEGDIFGMPDEGENIRLHVLEYQQLEALFQQGRLSNGPVIIALQWLRQHINTLTER